MPNMSNMPNMPNMPNMSNTGMNMNMPMANNIMNTSFYVPKSEGTSIASIMQNKKTGSSQATQMKSPNITSVMLPNLSHNNHSARRAYDNADNKYGFNVDSNGYPVPIPRPYENNDNNVNNNEQNIIRQDINTMSNDTDITNVNNDVDYEYDKIMALANDVSNSLEQLEKNEKKKKFRKYKSSKNNKDTDSNIGNPSSSDKMKDSDKNSENPGQDTEEIIEDDPLPKQDYAMMILEPLLLLTIYVIYSQPFVFNIASKYIDQLNDVDDSGIPLSGIIIYGMLIVFTFIVLRKLIQYKIEN